METLPALHALCEGNPTVTGGFPSQRAGISDLWYFFSCYHGQSVEQTVVLHLSLGRQDVHVTSL